MGFRFLYHFCSYLCCSEWVNAFGLIQVTVLFLHSLTPIFIPCISLKRGLDGRFAWLLHKLGKHREYKRASQLKWLTSPFFPLYHAFSAGHHVSNPQVNPWSRPLLKVRYGISEHELLGTHASAHCPRCRGTHPHNKQSVGPHCLPFVSVS